MLKLVVDKVKKLDNNVSSCLIIKTREDKPGKTEMGWLEIANPVKKGDIIACGTSIKKYKREIVLIKNPQEMLTEDLDANHKHYNKCVFLGKR